MRMRVFQANDEFMVLACDGIYDVLSNEELCRLVRSRLQATDDLKQATNQVLDVCLSLGSRDNMTMILVVLDAAPKTDPAKVESEREWLQRADQMLDGREISQVLCDGSFQRY